MFTEQGTSNKSATNEVEIIRYQVLIPVTEVQVRASSAKDMDSHFLWELIHLRSQLQRRSEKIYVLSNSTADFRNAFLKTIRQIIRESVRNMSIPLKGLGSTSSINELIPTNRGINSQTLERPKQQVVSFCLSMLLSPINSNRCQFIELINLFYREMKLISNLFQPIMQGSHTLGKSKKSKTSQRHSAGNIDYDNVHCGQDSDDPPQPFSTFRTRSKTVGDTAGMHSIRFVALRLDASSSPTMTYYYFIYLQ